MSRSNRSSMRIGCPACNATVNTPLPPGPGLVDVSDETLQDDSNRLQGTETRCQHCGHELELYYY
ncbi:hypothetical protein D8Y22_04515 [Salinadaptatus halalkaliphilus]|uniref:Uncharacterized protein n=1 Tax=Salinadaptatus halalkaliphilus TaxID=2419781 RepID=A0A4S3TPS4_9EURY|nr:hypothetical protein [Salinadaptatus halalkaliphilus]THE66216.1 hypothetical protein D8Y22_04515 [Salinadaptatus halalkaliphilus]